MHLILIAKINYFENKRNKALKNPLFENLLSAFTAQN